MKHLIRPPVLFLCLTLCMLGAQRTLAWDSVGHRVSAAVALHYIGEELRSDLLDLLAQHPRYEEDFLQQMPNSITAGTEQERAVWLLGQAAFWPDIARGLPEADRERYNRANWHYLDGAWLRGQATRQGNTYLGVSPRPDILGSVNADQIDNVMTALDHNSALLADEQAPADQRAVALCWLLHLVADIHQPLHTGSLYSATIFQSGDRGGNGVETDEGNLHARWDRALRSEGINASFDSILDQHGATLEAMVDTEDGDWSLWLHESRALLLNTVYTEAMKTAILNADNTNETLSAFELDSNYIDTMQYHAGMRLALAGRRLALWFDENL